MDTHAQLVIRALTCMALGGITENTLRSCAGPQQGCQAKIADLDNALTAIDEDVVAFQIPVDDGWRVSMEIHQPAQNLPCPAFQDLPIHLLVPLSIPERQQLAFSFESLDICCMWSWRT